MLADDNISSTMLGSVAGSWNAFSQRLLRFISGTEVVADFRTSCPFPLLQDGFVTPEYKRRAAATF